MLYYSYMDFDKFEELKEYYKDFVWESEREAKIEEYLKWLNFSTSEIFDLRQDEREEMEEEILEKYSEEYAEMCYWENF